MASVSKNDVAKEIVALLSSYLQVKPTQIKPAYKLKTGLKMTGLEIELLYKPCTRIAKRLGSLAGSNPLTVKRREAKGFKSVADIINLTHKRANGDNS